MVLKEVEVTLLTSGSMSWKETFFLPDLPMVLKEVSLPLFIDCVFDSIGIILFSDYSYAIYTNGVKRSQLVPVLLSPASCVSLAGVLKGVLVHVHIAMLLKELHGWS